MFLFNLNINLEINYLKEGFFMKKLPIGISDFKKLITNNYIYVDKTKYIYELISNGGYIFLSRPKRFGKSLLLSTIEYLHEGQRELFKGLYIENKWDWNEKYPVIKINFAKDIENKEELKKKIYYELKKNYKKYEIKMGKKEEDGGYLLEELVMQLNEKYKKQVVVLIDEYDKPILDVIEDKKQAEEVRKTLKEFYSVLKGIDEYIKFVIVTGV